MAANRREVVIVGAARTAIGKFGGALSAIPAPALGATAIKGAVARSGVPVDGIDEVYMGNVVSAAIGQAPARQAALQAGLPPTVGAATINKVCGSGLKAVMLAAQAIKAGDADIIVAGGMESMNMAPYMLKQARSGYRLGNGELIDAVVHDGLWCASENWHMGMAAEYIAEQSGVTRQAQDEFALRSHQKAVAAIAAGRFKAEIAPVEIPQRKGPPLVFDTDECPRADTSLEALARLRPVFKEGGTVTAGNAPGITDGAAAVVVCGLDTADRLGLRPLARIVGYTHAALEPKRIFYAPILAVRKLMQRTGETLDSYTLIEVNEAFAAQVLADGAELGWDWERVNVNGGAIALGHPIGASGARVLVTLLYAMAGRGVKNGLATLCLGGGEAVAMSIERVA
jgi:acetyl-CoA C-acetyltransferase